MDQIKNFLEPGRQFTKDSFRLVKRCTKPDRKGKEIHKIDFFTKNLLFILPVTLQA